jgi:hypothetical protein
MGEDWGVSTQLSAQVLTAEVLNLKADPTLAKAVEQAKAAAILEAGNSAFIGEHLGLVMEAENLATHLFTCMNKAYVGWQWAVTLAITPKSKSTVTVTDVVLLPGPDSLLAPAWLPWSERIQPGDLSPGDVLPVNTSDERLTAGFAEFFASEIDEDFEYVEEYRGIMSGWELGLGRARVLSVVGREQAADRWRASEFGPATEMARLAPATCSSCGFQNSLAGPLGQAFAVCTNALSPADGRVVSLSFGCGAHSGTVDPGFSPVERAGVASID